MGARNAVWHGAVSCPPFAEWPQSDFELPSVFGRGFDRIFIGLNCIFSRRFWMRLLPKPLGDFEGIYLQILPPGHFIAGLMKLPMMTAAERHGELIADFETQ